MSDSEKEQLLAQAIKYNQEFLEMYPSLKENQEKVEKYINECENNTELTEFTDKSREFVLSFGDGFFLFNFRCSNNPEGIKNPKVKESYLSLSEIDRKLAIELMKNECIILMPFDSIQEYSEKCHQQLLDLNEQVEIWNSNL